MIFCLEHGAAAIATSAESHGCYLPGIETDMWLDWLGAIASES